jgi:hypothetical protein
MSPSLAAEVFISICHQHARTSGVICYTACEHLGSNRHYHLSPCLINNHENLTGKYQPEDPGIGSKTRLKWREGGRQSGQPRRPVPTCSMTKISLSKFPASSVVRENILWRAAWKPERRSGLAKHVSPATFGSADKNRIAPVSIQRKPLYNYRGNAIAIQSICWKRFRHNVTLIGHVLYTVSQEAI